MRALRLKNFRQHCLGSVLMLLLLLTSQYVKAQSIVARGTVKDGTGQPLPGASVIVKGSAAGVVTDVEGKFNINAPDNAILLITYVGYQSKEITAKAGQALNVVLSGNANSLEEVVVVAYGAVKKKDLTGSVAVINVENAKKTASYDVARILQGQAAGVSVQGSGEPGSFVNIKIRGISSFTNNNPMFIVDGVPVDAPYDFSTGDIESIQVLKDASAAALYGSRAAAGVIIITTKKGKAGALRANYNGYYALQDIPKRIDVTDRVGYQKITSAAELNAGLVVAPGNDPNNPAFIDDVDTDWQEEMYKTGRMQDHNLSLSGGSDAITYNVGLGYFDQTSTLVGPQSYKRYTYNGNFQGKKGIFSFGGKTAYTQSHKDNLAITTSHAVYGGGLTSMLTAIPTMPVYDSNRLGGFGGSDNVTQRAITLNVIGMNSLVKDYSDRNRFLGNVWGELEILKNLKYKVNLSFDRADFKNYHYEPRFDLGFYYLNTLYYLRDERGKSTTALAENILTYMLQAGKHKVDFLAGTTFQQDNFENLIGSASAASDLRFYNFGSISNPSEKGITGFFNEHTLLSYLGRVNYNYDGRYLLTASVRRDGSSRFGPSNKYGNFPSIALAWNVSNEKFIKLPTAITLLKLRGSWGSIGNERFADYMFQSYINANASYVFGNVLAPGATVVAINDPGIKWESTVTTNVAIDLGLFNDKVQLTAEYYRKKATDIIVGVPLPLSVGSFPATLTTNAASVQNSGLEFNLTYKDNAGDFNYDVTANFSTLKNKVLTLGGLNSPIYGSGSKTEVGREVGELFGLKSDGIFQNAQEVADHADQPSAAPGDIRYVDTNGDGVITDNDRVYLGTTVPKIYYGLNFNATYKGFDASFFFQGSAGNKVFNGVYQGLMAGQYGNHSVDELNFWTPTNTNTNVPRPIIGDPNGNNRFSDRFVEDGSYVRLQNAQLGYTVPKTLLNKTKFISSFRVYVSGQNLLTISNYRNYDPDFISDGLFSRGFDYGSFPNPRTIMLGLQIGL